MAATIEWAGKKLPGGATTCSSNFQRSGVEHHNSACSEGSLKKLGALLFLPPCRDLLIELW